MLFVFRSKGPRVHTFPHADSVMNCWNGRSKSVAFFNELSTYSVPSTSFLVLSPLSKSFVISVAPLMNYVRKLIFVMHKISGAFQELQE